MCVDLRCYKQDTCDRTDDGSLPHSQHQPDPAIGVHLMDRYTFYVLEFLEEINPASQTNMNDLVSIC